MTRSIGGRGKFFLNFFLPGKKKLKYEGGSKTNIFYPKIFFGLVRFCDFKAKKTKKKTIVFQILVKEFKEETL